jgi:NAD(P)-dependent dehydrogenase (short-subunit alcohol dehydrogenase family)
MICAEDDLRGLRIFIVGASSGIGREIAVAAHGRGAAVALAARRIDLLAKLADSLNGTAYELDVSDPVAVDDAVKAAAKSLGEFDAVVFTSAVLPLAHVEHIDAATWLHAFAVNAVGASHVLRAAVPHLSSTAVVLVTSCRPLGDPRAGVAAYNTSKAALDEMLRAWRGEHPDLAIIRASLGPTADTEILRGADRELLDSLYESWVRRGQLPEAMSSLSDVANTLLGLIALARRNTSVITEVVELTTRTAAGSGTF